MAEAIADFDRSHVRENGRRFRELSGMVREAGLLKLRPARYIGTIALNTALLGSGLTAFFLIGDSWWQIPVAAWMGFCGGQSAFLWHDAAHKAMFRNKKAVTLVG